MYDIDSNGSVDRQEMLKIIEVEHFLIEIFECVVGSSRQFMIYSVLVFRKVHRMVRYAAMILMIHPKVGQHKYLR